MSPFFAWTVLVLAPGYQEVKLMGAAERHPGMLEIRGCAPDPTVVSPAGTIPRWATLLPRQFYIGAVEHAAAACGFAPGEFPADPSERGPGTAAWAAGRRFSVH